MMARFPAPPSYRVHRPGLNRRNVVTDAPVATEGSAYHGAKESIAPLSYTNGKGERVTFDFRFVRKSPKLDL